VPSIRTKDGKQGRRLSKSGDAEVWTRPLSGGAQAIALFDRSAEAAKITIKMFAL
jgi:alpha-galactosidase